MSNANDYGKIMLGRFGLFICACAILGGCANKLPSRGEPKALDVEWVESERAGHPGEFRFCEPNGGAWGCRQPSKKTPVKTNNNTQSRRAGSSAANHHTDQNHPEYISQSLANVDPDTHTHIGNVYFDFDKHQLDADALNRLRGMEDLNKSQHGLAVYGFTDHVGPERYNDELALNRALSVKEFVQNVVSTSVNIHAEGQGRCCYVAPNSTDSGRHLNRRVEIFILKE